MLKSCDTTSFGFWLAWSFYSSWHLIGAMPAGTFGCSSGNFMHRHAEDEANTVTLMIFEVSIIAIVSNVKPNK